jgi:hypothetical protein
MSERQEQRFDELVARYHLGGKALRYPGYNQNEDGSHTETYLVVEDEERDLAASEFRCAGFVVTIEPLPGGP